MLTISKSFYATNILSVTKRSQVKNSLTEIEANQRDLLTDDSGSSENDYTSVNEPDFANNRAYRNSFRINPRINNFNHSSIPLGRAVTHAISHSSHFLMTKEQAGPDFAAKFKD